MNKVGPWLAWKMAGKVGSLSPFVSGVGSPFRHPWLARTGQVCCWRPLATGRCRPATVPLAPGSNLRISTISPSGTTTHGSRSCALQLNLKLAVSLWLQASGILVPVVVAAANPVWVVARQTDLNAPNDHHNLTLVRCLALVMSGDGMGDDNAQRHRSVHGLGIRGCPVDARSSVDQHVNVRNPPPTVMRVPFADFAALHELRYEHSSVRLSYGACMVWACLLQERGAGNVGTVKGTREAHHRIAWNEICRPPCTFKKYSINEQSFFSLHSFVHACDYPRPVGTAGGLRALFDATQGEGARFSTKNATACAAT